MKKVYVIILSIMKYEQGFREVYDDYYYSGSGFSGTQRRKSAVEFPSLELAKIEIDVLKSGAFKADHYSVREEWTE